MSVESTTVRKSMSATGTPPWLRPRTVGRWLEGVATAASGMALVVIGVVTIVDVVMRYVVGAPLTWVLGLVTDYLLVAMFFLGLSYTHRTGSHVRVESLYVRFPSGVRWLADVVGEFLALSLFVLMGTAGLLRTYDAWAAGEILPPGGAELPWPTWTSLALVPLGVIVLVVRILRTLLIIASVRGARAEEV